MGAAKFNTHWARVCMQILLCAPLLLSPGIADAQKAKKPAAAKKPAPAPAPVAQRTQLSEAPQPTDLKARLAWANSEADGLRAIVATSPRDEPTRVLLVSLTSIVAADLEHVRRLQRDRPLGGLYLDRAAAFLGRL